MDNVKSKNKKIQVNVDRHTASEAEDIMNEMGLNPTVVINALYKEIVATKKIPLSFELTREQIDDLRLKEVASTRPSHVVRTKKDLEEFFNED